MFQVDLRNWTVSPSDSWHTAVTFGPRQQVEGRIVFISGIRPKILFILFDAIHNDLIRLMQLIY